MDPSRFASLALEGWRELIAPMYPVVSVRSIKEISDLDGESPVLTSSPKRLWINLFFGQVRSASI